MDVPEIRALVTEMRERHLKANNRRDQTAMGIEGAVTLVAAVSAVAGRLGRICRVADLGSGFSSALLRRLAQHVALEVWTVDTDWKWLGATLAELEWENVGTDHCHHLDVFDAMTELEGHFDVLFVDIGPTAVRVRLAERGRLGYWLAPGGLILLDDWHMPHYREAMQPALEAQGFAVKPCRGSQDRHGRYLAEARRIEAAP